MYSRSTAVIVVEVINVRDLFFFSSFYRTHFAQGTAMYI